MNITGSNFIRRNFISNKTASRGIRYVPQKVSERFCSAGFKMLFRPIFDYRTKKYPEVIKKSLQEHIKEVKIPTKKGSIYAWELNPQNSDKYILFLHGIKGKSPMPANQIFLEMLNQKGYGVITPEYRGTGHLKKKPFHYSSLVEDSRATLEYLKNKGIKSENITVVSHCIGSIPASQLACEESNINKLILIAPFIDGKELGSTLSKGFRFKVPEKLKKGLNKLINVFMPYDMKTTEAIKDAKTKVKIIVPEHDLLVSMDHAKRFSRNMPNLEELVSIPEEHALTRKSCKTISQYI